MSGARGITLVMAGSNVRSGLQTKWCYAEGRRRRRRQAAATLYVYAELHHPPDNCVVRDVGEIRVNIPCTQDGKAKMGEEEAFVLLTNVLIPITAGGCCNSQPRSQSAIILRLSTPPAPPTLEARRDRAGPRKYFKVQPTGRARNPSS